jgi:SAM-dependent methyltransferase
MEQEQKVNGGFIQRLRDRLAEPRLAGIDVDSDELIAIHRRILGEKKMMREVVREVYQTCADLDRRYLSGAGYRVELGAGASLFKDFYPDVITTDIKWARHLDLTIDAQAMPFADASVRAFYGIECFHHLPDVGRFFNELARTLVPGGGCILIEPYYGPVARLLFKRLFAREDFDPAQKEWNQSAGPMRGANQALSYVVFTRDRQRFDADYPELSLLLERPLDNYLRYLLSGGLNFRALVPGACAPLLRLCEFGLKPINRVVALHHVIVLRKNP